MNKNSVFELETIREPTRGKVTFSLVRKSHSTIHLPSVCRSVFDSELTGIVFQRPTNSLSHCPLTPAQHNRATSVPYGSTQLIYRVCLTLFCKISFPLPARLYGLALVIHPSSHKLSLSQPVMWERAPSRRTPASSQAEACQTNSGKTTNFQQTATRR